MTADATADLAAIRQALPAGATSVEVTGTDGFAESVRDALGSPAGGPPSVIVETTGVPATIAAALERLDDLGTLVLARPAAGPADLDLYSDLHVRGLTVVGAGSQD